MHLNIDSKSLSTVNVEFFGGDWEYLSDYWDKIDEQTSITFDFILTSETIYRSDLYARIHRIMNSCLSETGEILMACKSSYGPGGSLSEFLTYVSEQGIFDVTTYQVHSTSVIRFIVVMKRRLKQIN